MTLSDGEKITGLIPVREYKEDECLFMVTRKGTVKKTALADFANVRKGGIIAIKLREDDEVVDVAITQSGDEVVLSTARGMAIRFNQADARPMGRNTSGVKGISLLPGDSVVGMVVADVSGPTLTLSNSWQQLTVTRVATTAGANLGVRVSQSGATSGDAIFADAFRVTQGP